MVFYATLLKNHYDGQQADYPDSIQQLYGESILQHKSIALVIRH